MQRPTLKHILPWTYLNAVNGTPLNYCLTLLISARDHVRSTAYYLVGFLISAYMPATDASGRLFCFKQWLTSTATGTVFFETARAGKGHRCRSPHLSSPRLTFYSTSRHNVKWQKKMFIIRYTISRLRGVNSTKFWLLVHYFTFTKIHMQKDAPFWTTYAKLYTA